MYKEITSLEEALKTNKAVDFSKLPDLSFMPMKYSKGMLALLTLQVIIFAVNNDDPKVTEWKPDYNDSNQQKWAPWFRGGDASGAGFSFVDSYCGWSYSDSFGGARLALKDEARSNHMGKYFLELYKDLNLMIE